jgi:hypothetical protein
MKPLLLPVCLLSCLSCSLQEQPAEAEVTKEVIALTHTYNQVWKTLDMGSAARYYWPVEKITIMEQERLPMSGSGRNVQGSSSTYTNQPWKSSGDKP